MRSVKWFAGKPGLIVAFGINVLSAALNIAVGQLWFLALCNVIVAGTLGAIYLSHRDREPR